MKLKLFTLISIIIIHCSLFKAEAQDSRIVSGVVLTFRQYPLKRAQVVASKSREIVYTDSVGRFAIECYNNDVLTASASGFNSRKTRIGKQNLYSIDLMFEDNVVNFNDAINNGHITEDALRKAIFEKKVKDQKDYSIYLSIYDLIASEIYSVTVKGTSVYNKKIRSFDQTPQVLYVVDGKIVSDVSFVSPNHVKTIEFIDDVGATLYGVQGANGVIKIVLF